MPVYRCSSDFNSSSLLQASKNLALIELTADLNKLYTFVGFDTVMIEAIDNSRWVSNMNRMEMFQ